MKEVTGVQNGRERTADAAVAVDSQLLETRM